MSLAAELLKNPKAKLPGAAPVAPKRIPVESGEDTSKSVKGRIYEGARAARSLTLSAQEVAALRQILEAADADPFANTEPVLDTSDLEMLKLDINPDENKEEEADPFGNPGGGSTVTAAPVGIDRLGTELAIVAPDATPGHDEPIPASVLMALDVLQSGDEPQPVTPSAVAQRSAAPPALPQVTSGPQESVRKYHPEFAAALGETRQTSVPLRGNNPAPTGPVLAEGEVPIGAVMGNWRKAFKKTQSE